MKTRMGGGLLSKVPTPLVAWMMLSTTMALGACSQDDQLLAPDVPTEDLAALLFRAIQDEFHAEAVYSGVLEDFGLVRPFSNIVGAEERHSAAIARAYESRGWSVPASTWSVESVPRFQSLSEACQVGADAEVDNIEVYDELLEEDLPDDVLQIFMSNRAASLNNHLPAFLRCS